MSYDMSRRIIIIYREYKETRPLEINLLLLIKILCSREYKIASNRMKEHNCIKIVKLRISHIISSNKNDEPQSNEFLLFYALN
jgi:hypothetical protein